MLLRSRRIIETGKQGRRLFLEAAARDDPGSRAPRPRRPETMEHDDELSRGSAHDTMMPHCHCTQTQLARSVLRRQPQARSTKWATLFRLCCCILVTGLVAITVCIRPF